MGTTSLSASGDADLYADLTESIRDAGHQNPGARAGALLCRHYDDRILVGLLDDGQAVYYSGLTRCVAAVPFDSDTVYLSKARPITQSIDDVDSWVVHCGSDYNWSWRLPRFR